MPSYNSALHVLPLVFQIVPPVRSVADFGCGYNPDWLLACKDLGVKNVKGYDLLGGGINNFVEVADIANAIRGQQRYDLAMSLEVVEHIHRNGEAALFDSLVAASDFILFSGATPGQICNGHINCNWPAHWNRQFNKRGYKCADCLRWALWDNSNVDVWYRQNILLYAKDGVYNKLKLPKLDISVPRNMVHAELWSSYCGTPYYGGGNNQH